MSDSAVPWQMSVDTESPTSQNVLVSGGSHRDLADHPKVREIIADRLAQPPGEWRPFAG
jgi:muramidase (phage lysozyme)